MNSRKLTRIALVAISACSLVRPADAAIIGLFDLKGNAGNGILAANEPSLNTPSTASGGEIGAGITLDDGNDANPNTNFLTVSNVGWGSSQGFNDLVGTASASHIHGPTAGINGGGGFTQTAGVLFTLTRSSSAVTGGTFTNAPIALTQAQVFEAAAGRYYVNIHTTSNTGGELRGFLVSVPEPTSLALLAVGGVCAFFGRRKR